MSLDMTLYFDVETGGEPYRCEVFEANITHNLIEMASVCGLYNPMWRPYRLYNIPDEDGDSFTAEAGEIYDALMEGIKILKSDPDRFKQFNASNGYGTYEGLLGVAKRYAEACKRYPNAKVHTCR